MGASTSAHCQPQCSEVSFDDVVVCAATSISAFDPNFSEFAEEECLDREPSGILPVKATLASHALRYLSRQSSECSWEQLRCEFEVQSGIWERLNSGDSRNEGLLVQLKLKIECGLAMHKGGCSGDAIVAVQAALMMDAAAKHVSRHVTATEMKAMEAEFSKAGLSPRMKACAEEVMVQMCVSQARHELAEYLDMVASLDDSRLDKPKRWFLNMAKACDLKYGVLKEYINEVLAADAQLHAERTMIAATSFNKQP